MSYHTNGERVTLEMSEEDYRTLLCLLGFATFEAGGKGPKISWAAVKFINELNRGNPNFTPYEIPAICAHCQSEVTDAPGHVCQTEKVIQ